MELYLHSKLRRHGRAVTQRQGLKFTAVYLIKQGKTSLFYL